MHDALRQWDVDAVAKVLTRHNARAVLEEDPDVQPIDRLVLGTSDCEQPFLECTRLLMEAGATPNTPMGALQLCIGKKSNRTVIQFLKLTKADPNHHVTHTPLMLALIIRSKTLVHALLEAGANPTCEGKKERQVAFAISTSIPLHEAIVWGNWDVVHDLLAHGADPFQTDRVRGLSALVWARHAAAAPRSSALHAAQILTFFEDLEEARRCHTQRMPDLHKDLVEYAFHPARLQTQGFFSLHKD